MEGGKVKGSNMTYNEVIKGKIDEYKKIQANKRALQQKKNDFQNELDELDSTKSKLLKSLKQDYTTEEQIREAMRQIEFKRMNTQFKSATEENKLIKEINTLKESIPQAQELAKIKPQIQELQKKKQEVWNELKEVKKVDSEKNAEIESLRKDMEARNEEKADQKSKGDAITKQIDNIQD